MPGIVAIISRTKSSGECENLVQAMLASMMHERFYVSGPCLVPELGIYGAWVAHPSSFAASVSGFYDKDGVALAFAGECFPDDLETAKIRGEGPNGDARGVNWLVNRYREHGERFTETLNGQFSGLLIDRKRQCALIFNDRYGIERVYYHETKDATYFASEAKAILRVLPTTRAFDGQGLIQFLSYGCTFDHRTLFRGVTLVPGGSLWAFEGPSVRRALYFTPSTWEAQPTLTHAEFEERFLDTFKKVLPRYFQQPSDIGISLTAGLDTRMILACRPETTTKPVCYTFAGMSGATIDAHLAAKIAATCHLKHTMIRIESDFFSAFPSHVDKTVYSTDGYFGVLGAHEIYLNAKARPFGSVRLTGVFGSEILRGMSTFKPLGLSNILVSAELRREIATASRLIVNDCNPVTFAAFREAPWSIFGSLAACRSQVAFRTPYLDNEIVALAYRAPNTQRDSRAVALQLIRQNHPSLSSIPTDRAALIDHTRPVDRLRRFASELTFKLDYIHNEGSPHWLTPLDPLFFMIDSKFKLFGRHKFLHYRHWFKRELHAYVAESLLDNEVRSNALWNPQFIARISRDHAAGRGNYVAEINAILTLRAIERLLFRTS